MARKTHYLQIRLTPREKAELKRRAQAAGQDVSSYVLGRALPAAPVRFEELVRRLGEAEDHRYALAELNDLLTALGAPELNDAVARVDVAALSHFLQNYVAAMVEQACSQKGVTVPEWTRSVPPLEAPYFATELKSLRLHLLRASPVPFKRRNLFVDAGVGSRV